MNISKHKPQLNVFCIGCLQTDTKTYPQSLNDMCNCLHFRTSIFGGCILPKNCIIRSALSLHTDIQCPDVLKESTELVAT